MSSASRVGLSARALVGSYYLEVARFRFPPPTNRFTCPRMQNEAALQDDRPVESVCQFHAVTGCVDFLLNPPT